jgi:hypothetical protein
VNLIDSTYRFKNKTQIYFLMAAYRPTASQKFFKNIEYIFRYDVLDPPLFALWKNGETRWTAGIMYWFAARSGMKVSFQNGTASQYLIFQWVIGL